MTNEDDITNDWAAIPPGEGQPLYDNAPDSLTGYTPELYADLTALASEDYERLIATIGKRQDGKGIFYPGKTNTVVGDSGEGKTLFVSCVIADELFKGNSALLIDIDHNGALETYHRFRDLGVKAEVLQDPRRFRYASPETPGELLKVIEDAKTWQPTITVLDSVGELIPLFGAKSNDGDDYTSVNRKVNTPLEKTGTCLITIDHLAKSSESRAHGAIGTSAKKRTVNGVTYRYTRTRAFAPGFGGKAALRVIKDRVGDILANALRDTKEPLSLTFELLPGDAMDWRFYSPQASDAQAMLAQTAKKDVDLIISLNLQPASQRDMMKLLKEHAGSCGQDRAKNAFEHYLDLNPYGLPT